MNLDQLIHKGRIFVHIPKTGGSSMTLALGLPRKRHLTVAKIIEQVGYEAYRDAFTFTIVRNPYDREESFYKYLKGKNPGRFKDFADYVDHYYIKRRAKYPEHHNPQVDWLTYNKVILVDRILRFETLNEDYEGIRNIVLGGELPHVNKSGGVAEWTPELREIIYEHYKKDFKRFGYKA